MSKELSIVVAVQGGADKLDDVLGSIGAQRTADVEVLVCYAGEEESVPGICGRYPFVRALPGARGALIPHLWRDGIDAAEGRKVAITIVHCRPGPDWVGRLLAVDLATFAAVGGALENEAASDALGWAVYLLRYLHYVPPFSPRETADLPGDNVVYDRQALLAHREIYRDGFWEPEIHHLLERDGKRLLLDPALVTVHANGYRALGFARQRFLHGTRFGRDRAKKMSATRRLIQVALAPAVPALFGSKVVRGAWARPELRLPLVRALPHLALFLHAWAAGELRGTLQAVVGREA